MVETFLDEFETERQELHEVLKAAREMKRAAPEYIVGYELLDVVHQMPNLQAKVIKLCNPQPWSHLVEEAPVLLAKDLGQPIVSNKPERLCHLWKEVPRDGDYLVATAKALQYPLEVEEG